MNRGYFGVGVFNLKTETNLGTLWRSAHNFGAAFIFTIGKRYRAQASDTTKAERHVPLYDYADLSEFLAHCPSNCQLIGVEQCPRSRDLAGYHHAERAIYLLGAEDNGLPESVYGACESVVSISTPMCLNVAVAGSIVMYDRAAKLAVEV